MENDPPDILDMKMAIRSMRNNKVSGTDNIRIKPCKKGGQLLMMTDGFKEGNGLQKRG